MSHTNKSPNNFELETVLKLTSQLMKSQYQKNKIKIIRF